MSTLSTHVLDAASGTPAVGVRVTLASLDGACRELGSGSTDADGRLSGLAPDGLAPGRYRLTFDTGGYHRRTGQEGFFPEVVVCFQVGAERHYHVPLLLSPYAYSTYRGS